MACFRISRPISSAQYATAAVGFTWCYCYTLPQVRGWGKEMAQPHLAHLYDREEDPGQLAERKIISALYLETLKPGSVSERLHSAAQWIHGSAQGSSFAA